MIRKITATYALLLLAHSMLKVQAMTTWELFSTCLGGIWRAPTKAKEDLRAPAAD